jgi:hypothetical protein
VPYLWINSLVVIKKAKFKTDYFPRLVEVMRRANKHRALYDRAGKGS